MATVAPSSSIPVSYIEPAQLAEALKGPDRDQWRVIDVRDEDYAGGHIRGAIHTGEKVLLLSDHARCILYPPLAGSGQFSQESGVDQVIGQHLEGASKIVFHCMFSQQRGPRCATRLAKRLAESPPVGGSPAIYVLRGGFVHFVRMFSSDADLVEDVDPAVWE